MKEQGAAAWNVSSGWRWMFGSEALPAVALLLLLLLVPETKGKSLEEIEKIWGVGDRRL